MHFPINNKAFKFFLFVAILFICWYLGRLLKVDVAYYQNLLSRYPYWLSGLVFVFLYVLTTTFIWWGPKDILRISSAVLFGGPVSAVYVWTSEMVNAVIMFHLSRNLGREYVQQKLKVKARDLDRMEDDTSLLSVAAWRINPLVPFRFIDLAYGLTRIPFRKYAVGIAAVTFLRVLWLQCIIAGVGTAVFTDIPAVMQYFLDRPFVIRVSAVYFLAVIITTLCAVAGRAFRRRALKDRPQPSQPGQ